MSCTGLSLLGNRNNIWDSDSVTWASLVIICLDDMRLLGTYMLAIGGG